jgi:arylsulfatase A-like enzyme
MRRLTARGCPSLDPVGRVIITGLTAALVVTGCRRETGAVDLVATARTSLREATVGGHGPSWVRERVGRSVKIGAVIRASLPADPPSRIVLKIEIPRGGRLVVAAGISGEGPTESAVDFSVAVRRGKVESRVASESLDPASRPADRKWVPLEADLSRYQGPADLVLETSSPAHRESTAVWGNPVIIRPDDRQAPLVVVYLVDTLRRDHLSLYGYKRPTSPSLDRFASDAVVFEQAVAPSSWTIPSVGSLFTSLLPDEHGAVDLLAPLAPTAHTLAERLAEGGFATGTIMANPLIQRSRGFEQGFTYFAGLRGRRGRPSRTVSAGRVVDGALRFLETHRGLPVFLYVHAFDPHSPYQPPPPFDQVFRPLSQSDRDQAVALYDGEIAYGDREFGRFVAELKATGIYERALVVFTSDHGEEFLDHGDWRHGNSLFDELVRVPLVVKFPGGVHAGLRVDRQVQLLDVLPTVLRALSLPMAPPLLGHPLQDTIGGESEPRPALMQLSNRGYVVYAARTRDQKVVHSFSPRESVRSYDLLRDPGEQHPSEVTGASAAPLLRMVEAAMAPSRRRFHIRVGGSGVVELRVRTTGTIVEVGGPPLGTQELSRLDSRHRELDLTLRPRAGHPREISLRLRPHGAPLWLDGTRDGRPLRAADIHVGSRGAASGDIPFAFPVVEESPGVFDPTPAGPWVAVWLTHVTPGSEGVPLDEETREELRALGYLGR